MNKCLVCEHEVTEFISFGRMPIANGFLLPAEYGKEYFFELRVGFCPRCSMVQLLEQPDREMMFHENYAYFSSISTRMAEHFKDFAGYVRGKCLGGKDPFVVELGSNDGIMLQNFAEAGIRHLGVEPSANVAEAARKRGVNTICEFFDEALAERVLRESGPADAILAANVMCHIPYLHSVAAGMAKLLAPKGVVMFEDPYLGDIVEKTAYDQIYDEHAFYFSVASVECLFNQHGWRSWTCCPSTPTAAPCATSSPARGPMRSPGPWRTRRPRRTPSGSRIWRPSTASAATWRPRARP
jgi:methylation protein EvaC